MKQFIDTLARPATVLWTMVLLTVALPGCPGPTPVGDSPVGAQQLGAEFGLTVRYDRDTSTVVLTDADNRISATTALPYIMINDTLEDLPAPVVYNGAEVFFPGSVRVLLRRRMR